MSQNAVSLFLPLRLKMLIQQDCARNDQLPATVILRILTEHFKDEIPKNEFDALIYQYSLTAYEQKEAKKQKEKEPKQDAHERKLREEIAHYEAALRERENAYIRTKLERRKRELSIYLETKQAQKQP